MNKTPIINPEWIAQQWSTVDTSKITETRLRLETDINNRPFLMVDAIDPGEPKRSWQTVGSVFFAERVTLQIRIEQDDEKNVQWWCDSEDLPGFSAAGATLDEMRDNACSAVYEMKGTDAVIFERMTEDASGQWIIDQISGQTTMVS